MCIRYTVFVDDLPIALETAVGLFSSRLVLQQPLFGDVPSFFSLKVSKTFHKTANSFSVYFFLSLRLQSSQMLVVIS